MICNFCIEILTGYPIAALNLYPVLSLLFCSVIFCIITAAKTHSNSSSLFMVQRGKK